MSQREILFKAKRTDNGEWVEGWYCKETFGRWPVKPCIIPWENAENGYLEHVMVDGDTVCQYTGLTDKNGKKIFEGDVLSFYNDKPFTPWVAEVKWMHCEYYLDGVNRPSRVFLSDFLPEEMTITGNIHDN